MSSIRGILVSIGLLLASICSACSKTTPDILSAEPLESESYGSEYEKAPGSLRIMQWNIGHFSMGKSPNSKVTDELFNVRCESFLDVFSKEDADIIALCEYSMFFADTKNHPQCHTDTLLLKDHPYVYLGNDGNIRNYSFNTIFSRIDLSSNVTLEYDSNKNARITSSSIIFPSDYYYIRSSIELDGKGITLVATHLAFDLNNPEIATNQIKELIEVLKEEDYVILCGDFNTEDKSDYDLFIQAGYSLANKGDIATYPTNNPYKPLDNIVVKGLHISNVHITPTFLSDHFPIVCDVCF